MKHLCKFALLGVLLSASAPFVFADTISLGSFATGTTAASLGFSSSETAMNFAGYTAFSTAPAVASTPPLQNGIAPTYALSPAPNWANPLDNSTWVGYSPTAGPGGTPPPYGYYQFTTAFTALDPTGPYIGSIDIMADDTVEVLLNGNVIVPFGALGADTACAANLPNCIGPDLVDFGGVTLRGGVDANTLTFVVEQAGVIGPYGGDPSGVDFTASFAAPEPSGLLLLGSGMVTAYGMYFRRRNHTA